MADEIVRTVEVVDTIAPTNPSIESSDPTAGSTNDSSVDSLDWVFGYDSGSGVAGYSWVVDQISDTEPDQTLEPGLPSTIDLDGGDGDYWIHVRAQDVAGNWADTTYHYGPWQFVSGAMISGTVYDSDSEVSLKESR